MDSDVSSVMDMPSITKLLNRKKLGISEPTKTVPPPLVPSHGAPPPQTIAPEPPSLPSPQGEISISAGAADESFELESSRSPTQHAQIYPAQIRSEKHPARPLSIWTLEKIKTGADPLGRGLAILFEKSAKQALFLTIVPPSADSPVPHFTASAVVAPPERVRLWTGMKWEPTIVPELWNAFVRSGFAELSPPGTSTHIKSPRNVVRGAFGIQMTEWLLLVRAGPESSCRGVLAVISDRSLLQDLSAAQALIAAPANAKS